MKARSLARWLATLGAVALLASGSAFAAEVHLMISAGFYGVYAELGPAFERASGHRLITTRGRGLVRSGTKVDLARSQIGMVVRAGVAKPNIGSVEAFRRMLLAVKSIGYSDSASGTYL
jgi:molybdate transport system substrate-binding protein